MSKRIDPDILVLKQTVKALMQSTSQRMLAANIQYLNSYFILSPSLEVIKKFHKNLLSRDQREGAEGETK